MATGINIKSLPSATTVGGSDRIIIDKNIIGTRVIPFSAVVVDGTQVTFYSDFVNLSAYTYALSANTNFVFAKLGTKIDTVSANFIVISDNISQMQLDIDQLQLDVNYISNEVSVLSSNTTTFISGGISPSGSIVPATVGILYFAADTKDYFISIDNTTNKDWKRLLTVDY